MHLLRPVATAPTTPWANGAGITTELVSFEDSHELSPEGTPPWRLSIAQLERAAPFSALPGVLRTFMPLDGALALRVGRQTHDLRPGVPLHFSGEDDVALETLPAPCRALNLMVRGPRAGGIVAADGSGRIPRSALAVLTERNGELLVATPGVVSLTPRSRGSAEVGEARFYLCVDAP
ncbi:MAG: HutD family protein [Leucobacter sp.]